MRLSVLLSRSFVADVLHVASVLRDVCAYEVMKRRPLPELVQRFEPSSKSSSSPIDVERLVRLTKGALRRIYRRDFCLPQSLSLYRALAARGLRPQLVTGVRFEGHNLLGHAWVNVDGVPLGEVSDPGDAYSTTFQHPFPRSTGK